MRHRLCLLWISLFWITTLLPSASVSAAGTWNISPVMQVGSQGFTFISRAQIGDEGTIVVLGEKDGEFGLFRFANTITPIVLVDHALGNGLGTPTAIDDFAIDPQGRILFSSQMAGGTHLRVFRWDNGSLAHMLPDQPNTTHHLSQMNSAGQWLVDTLIGTTVNGTHEFRSTDGVNPTTLLASKSRTSSCGSSLLPLSGGLNAAGQALIFENNNQRIAGPSNTCPSLPATNVWSLVRTGSGAQQIVSGSYSVNTTAADGSSLQIAPYYRPYRLNNAGDVAYLLESGTSNTSYLFPRQQIFLKSGANQQLVADSDGSILAPYMTLLGFNHQGQVSFLSELDDGRNALFSGPDLVQDLVLRTGDPLFGDSLSWFSNVHVNSPPASFGENRSFIFTYTLDNGTVGIAVASKSDMRWTNASGGSWSSAANWSSNSVPGQGDSSVFDFDASYDVQVGTRQVGRISVQQGILGLRNADLSLIGPFRIGSNARVSVPEGKINGDDLVIGSLPPLDPLQPQLATLTVSNNGTLVQQSGTTRVGDAGPGRLRINAATMKSGEVLIGGAYAGDATVSAAGNWEMASLAVGAQLTGTLTLESGATMLTSGDAVIGHGTSSQAYQASVTVDNAGVSAPNTGIWRVGGIFSLGNRLLGKLVIRNGGIVSAADLFQSALVAHPSAGLSDARLEISGLGANQKPSSLLALDDMILGMAAASETSVTVTNGGLLSVEGDFVMAHEATSLVSVAVSGVHSSGLRSTIDHGDSTGQKRCLIGRGGRAILGVSNGALVDCHTVLLGSEAASNGTINLGGTANGQIATLQSELLCIGGHQQCGTHANAQGSINLHNGFIKGDLILIAPQGSINGNGNLMISSAGDFIVFGRLDPGIMPGAPQASGQASLQANQQAARTITVDGKLSLQPSATLAIDISGPSAYDQLVVNGKLARQGKLELRFQAGYTPRVGDSFQFIKAQESSGNFSNVVVSGLAPNTSYTLDTQGEHITLTIRSTPASGDQNHHVYLPLIRR